MRIGRVDWVGCTAVEHATDRAVVEGGGKGDFTMYAISHAATAVFPNAVGAQTIPSSWPVIFATASSWNGRS